MPPSTTSELLDKIDLPDESAATPQRVELVVKEIDLSIGQLFWLLLKLSIAGGLVTVLMSLFWIPVWELYFRWRLGF